MMMRWAVASMVVGTLTVAGMGCSGSESSGGGAPQADAGTPEGRGIEVTHDPDANAEPAGPPAGRYLGRFDRRDPTGPRAAWAGSRVLVRFEGVSLTATLDEESLIDGPSGYDVIVDGQVVGPPLFPTSAATAYPLARNLDAGTHVVELWR